MFISHSDTIYKYSGPSIPHLQIHGNSLPSVNIQNNHGIISKLAANAVAGISVLTLKGLSCQGSFLLLELLHASNKQKKNEKMKK